MGVNMTDTKKEKVVKDSFISRVKESYPSLHPVERQLAGFILDFPGELASYTASELASLAGVSNATVSRFIRHIGYQSFDEARRQVREERKTGVPLFQAERKGVLSGEKVADTTILYGNNITETFKQLGESRVNEISDKMLNSRRVWVFGFRASQALAAYFQLQLYQLNDEARLVHTGGGGLGEYLSAINEQDLIVLYGLRRRPTIWRQLLSQCIGTGAEILLISDNHLAFDQDVTWHIRCCCDNSGPLDDHTSVMALNHLLLNSAFERAGPDERRRLADSYNQHQQLDEM